MFLLDPIWAGATMAIIFLLGMYIYYRNPETNWGSSAQGQVFVDAVKAAHKAKNISISCFLKLFMYK